MFKTLNSKLTTFKNKTLNKKYVFIPPETKKEGDNTGIAGREKSDSKGPKDITPVPSESQEE